MSKYDVWNTWKSKKATSWRSHSTRLAPSPAFLDHSFLNYKKELVPQGGSGQDIHETANRPLQATGGIGQDRRKRRRRLAKRTFAGAITQDLSKLPFADEGLVCFALEHSLVLAEDSYECQETFSRGML
ncbi:MAG: hypothetical protein ACLR67_00210 [Eggerthella lenta]